MANFYFGQSSTSQRTWHEHETSRLIEAWGICYQHLNQINWQHVAYYVNLAQDIHWTPLECRARVDELLDRFRSKKVRVEASGGLYISTWRYYSMLEHVLAGLTTNAAPNAHVVVNTRVKKRKSGSSGLGCVADAVKRFAKDFERVEKRCVEVMREFEKWRIEFMEEMEKGRKKILDGIGEEVSGKRGKRSNQEVLHRGEGSGSSRGKDIDQEVLQQKGEGSESGKGKAIIELDSESESDSI